ISTLIYSFLKTKKIFIPLLLIGLGMLSVLPVIDAVSIGVRNQTNKINAYAAPHIDDEGVITSLEEDLSDKEKAKFSYSMNYLNQQDQLEHLDWLPETFEYYRDFDQTFGFDSSYHYYYASDVDMQDASGPRYAHMELDNSEPLVFPLEEVDELVELSTYQGSQIGVQLDKEAYRLELRAQRDELSLEVLEDEQAVIDFDLTFVLDDIWEAFQKEPQRPLEDMQFIEENETIKVHVIIRRLEVQENAYIEGEFILLITYK
ncbi:MAG: hypothetical protein ABS873_08320, partial [Alkalibacterium sp.]